MRDESLVFAFGSAKERILETIPYSQQQNILPLFFAKAVKVMVS
jgi:hypothetical protein